MACVTMDGYFDSARHEPRVLTRYSGMDLAESVRLHGWVTWSVYINDLRLQNGRPPLAEAYEVVEHATRLLRQNAQQAAHLLLIEPEGLDGRPHAVGGGWSPAGSGVTFYIARNNTTDGTGRMCKFLCADISIRA